MAASVSLQRTNARLLTLFGALATVVAMIGVYGVVSFTVSQRTHEIGVRMARGARPRDVRRMIQHRGVASTPHIKARARATCAR